MFLFEVEYCQARDTAIIKSNNTKITINRPLFVKVRYISLIPPQLF
ncbi:hypothetical protein LSO10F_160010 [Candidatus Liberibacter solanacearum]